ncbi:MAG: hypothetical protein Q7J42_04710 [Sulfuritalea sp.]|nr:hypothetical protein [Sulfuritalea sp.]
MSYAKSGITFSPKRRNAAEQSVGAAQQGHAVRQYDSPLSRPKKSPAMTAGLFGAIPEGRRVTGGNLGFLLFQTCALGRSPRGNLGFLLFFPLDM